MRTCGTLRNAHGSFAENQKLQLLRSTYQKAVATPLLGVENVWKEYNQFENVSTINIVIYMYSGTSQLQTLLGRREAS